MADRFDLKGYFNAWNTHAIERIVDYYADAVELVDPNTGQIVRGKAGLRAGIERTMRAFPDLNGDIETSAVTNETVAFLFHITGTNTGPWQGPEGKAMSATGKRVDYPMATFLKLDARGKIVHEVNLMDNALLMQQMGVDARTTQKQRQ